MCEEFANFINQDTGSSIINVEAKRFHMFSPHPVFNQLLPKNRGAAVFHPLFGKQNTFPFRLLPSLMTL